MLSKYSKTNVKPEIEISAKALKDEWHFQIKDNGIGINESYFEKIFTHLSATTRAWMSMVEQVRDRRSSRRS